MNNLKQELLNKSRSYTACISASHRMLFDNIRLIFKHTWFYTLLFALSIGLMSMFYVKVVTGGGYTSSSFVWLAVSIVLMACLQIGYVSRVLMLVNRQTMKWNVIRSIRLFLFYICISIIISVIEWALVYIAVGGNAVVTPDKLSTVTLMLVGSSIFFACVLLPYIYVFVKYMLEPESKFCKILFKSYKIGWRYWGFIFITILLAALCMAVCMFFVSIPMIIISMANTLSVMGVNYMGDPSGLPSYFGLLQYVVVSLSSFICLYINIFMMFVYYFMYGSIETREKERKEFLMMKHEA